MSYEIQSRNDFLTGSYLVTRIPENELDLHALNTIQADCPDFIVPFHYKNTNGQVELVYKIGTQCRLQYLSGDLSSRDYAGLWQSLLTPLLECGDWFMNPGSFVLNADYLYYDKNRKAVSYVYIPSANKCSGHEAFYEMAVEVSKMMTVSDAVLENKVLRAIIKDFNPIDFLGMLKDHLTEKSDSAEVIPVFEETTGSSINHDVTEVKDLPIAAQEIGEDAVIDIQPEIKFGQGRKGKETGGYKLFSGKGKRKKAAQGDLPEVVAQKPEYAQNKILKTVTGGNKQAEIIDITQSTSMMSGSPGLRYIGRAHLPPSIRILITEGEIFTIGRFDASVGKKQSSFEFDKKTKAVSRRHAVIERDVNGYRITDLSSTAGTFINDKKLPPNTPYELETGFRVSFGNSGADYVWEVS